MYFDFISFLKRKNLKQREAAELFGVTQATISNWCNGYTPDFGTICKLVSEGISAQELFGSELAEILKANDIEASGDHGEGAFERKVEKIVLMMKEKGII